MNTVPVRRIRTPSGADALGLPSACLFGLLVFTLLCVGSLQAQERIPRYDSEVHVLADGNLEVTERISVVAEGQDIRRGIYRDFPTRYRDRFGNRVRVDLEVLGVERDGQPEEWFTERVSNGIRINTGGDAFLPVPAEYTYTIRYRTDRQLGFFEAHDELYWNAIGTGWIFPIAEGSVVVRLPEPVPIEQMGAEGYTGPQGAQGQAYTAAFPEPGVARYELTAPLAPREGLTIVLMFPKSVVAEPTRAQRARWFFADNGGVLVALAGLLGLVAFCVRRWKEVGRDPPRGVIIPRYVPRDGQTPAAARYLRRMGYDDRCFSSDVLDLAVAGHLRLHRDERRKKGEWALERTGPLPDGGATSDFTSGLESRPMQARMLEELFKGRRGKVVLQASNAPVLTAARRAHQKALDRELHGPYFRRNAGSSLLAVLITFATGALSFLVSGGNGIPLILAVILVMLAITALFAHLVRAPTPEGRVLLDEIEGLRLYLSVAERDELAGMEAPGAVHPGDGGPGHARPVEGRPDDGGPGKARPSDASPIDAGRYEALLPFAVALEVEDAWTKKFTAAVGATAAAEATRRMGWYVGRGPVTNLGSFSKSLGSGLSSQIASASSPPGSSSGAGGGGSSGGGGGGGGGGGR